MSLFVKQHRPIPLLVRVRPGKSWPPNSAFSRPDGVTCATYRKSDGTIRLAPANVLRVHWADMDKDGIPEAPAILLEPTETNLALRSEKLATSPWSANLMTAVTEAALSLGDVSLSLMVPNGTSSNLHYAVQSGLSVNATDFFGIRVRVGTAPYTGAVVRVTGGDGVTNFVDYRIDMVAGTVTTAAAGTGASTAAFLVKEFGGVWELVAWGTIGETTAAAKIFVFAFDTGPNAQALTAFAGDTVKGIYAGCVHFRKGASAIPPLSYIPTGAGGITRAAETFYMGIAFPPRPISIYCEHVERGAPSVSSGIPRVWTLGDPSSANNPSAYLTQNAVYGARYVDGYNATQGPSAPGTPSYGDDVETCVTLDAQARMQAFLSINGGAVTTNGRSGGGFALARAWFAPRLVLTPAGCGNLIRRLAIADGAGFALNDMREVA